MPKVGKKQFAYTSAGVQAAKRESARTGQPLVDKKKKSSLAAAMRGASYGKTS